jgi:meso-butanediol dehydrogenase / (S,S)-butanediol dehydrogenase / diacetyl reductase
VKPPRPRHREFVSRQRIVIEADISNEPQVQSAVLDVRHEFDSLEVLVNNAGIEINGTVEEQPLQEWERQLAGNLRSVFLLSKYAMPALKRHGGNVINISSVHAVMSWRRCPAYDASKAGLIGLTKALALDHGMDGVSVNAICPGYIETPLLEQWFTSGAADRNEVLKSHPLGKIGKPQRCRGGCLVFGL